MASMQTWSAGRNPSLAQRRTASQVAKGTRANLTAQIAAMILYSKAWRGISILSKFWSGALGAFWLLEGFLSVRLELRAARGLGLGGSCCQRPYLNTGRSELCICKCLARRKFHIDHTACVPEFTHYPLDYLTVNYPPGTSSLMSHRLPPSAGAL